MPYVRKRGATWYYTIDIDPDPVTGKRRQVSKGGFSSERAALKAGQRAEMEVEDGEYVKEANMTFRQFTEHWLNYYRTGIISTRKPKPSSVRQREFQVATLLKYFDAVKISTITRKQYQDAILDLASKMARETVNGVHATGRMIFKRAVRDGVIKLDPSVEAKIPLDDEGDDSVPKYFEKDELAEFLRLAKRRGLDNDYPMFLVLAYTGMRVGELCALRWDDINFTDRTISIKGTLYNPRDLSTEYQIIPPKTKSSKRTIIVDEIVIVELERLRAEQNVFRMRNRKTWHDGGFVFGRMDNPLTTQPAYGYPPKRRTVELRMDRIVQWMNLPFKPTPHTLRHTHASLLAEAKATLESIQERLGHKDDRTTRLIYTHVTKTLKQQAADQFGELMSDVVKKWSN